MIAPALIVAYHGWLLPIEHQTLRHIGIPKRFHRQTEQQFGFCPYGVAGISRHNGSATVSLCSNLVQSCIIGIIHFQLIKYPEVCIGFRHDFNDIGLYSSKVFFRNIGCQIHVNRIFTVFLIIGRFFQTIGNVFRSGLHKECQEAVMVKFLI